MRFLTLGLAALTLAGIAAARVDLSRTNSSEHSLLNFETRPVLNHAIGQANTMLAHLQPSRLFDQAKGIFNGVSQGLTLYTTKSASRSTSAHTGMRRRQPRTSFILVASMWNWATFDAVKLRDRCNQGITSLEFGCNHITGTLKVTINDLVSSTQENEEAFVSCVHAHGKLLGKLGYFQPHQGQSSIAGNTLTIPIDQYRADGGAHSSMGARVRAGGKEGQVTASVKYQVYSREFKHFIEKTCSTEGVYDHGKKVHCCGK